MIDSLTNIQCVKTIKCSYLFTSLCCFDCRLLSRQSILSSLFLCCTISLPLVILVSSLDSQYTSTPLLLHLIISRIESRPCGSYQLLKVLLVARINITDSKARRSLFVDECTQSSLRFEDDKRDILLHAECWHPQHQFNRIHIVCNNH